MTDRPTAFITGASAGLGSEFARQLAAQGYDLLLTARRADRLAALAADLQARCGVRAEVLPADLADEAGLAAAEQAVAACGSLALLVNNAGFGTVGKFAAVELAKSQAMVRVHVEAALRLTHAALPGMLARGRGGLINVASVAAFNPVPGGAVYSGTKAFLINFSQSLAAEVRRAGVRVQALCPGFTYTEFHDTLEYSGFSRRQIPRLAWVSAESVVRESLAALPRGPVVCVPGWQYKLVVPMMRFVPLAPAAFAFIRRRRRA
jgi:hypothetical protein